MISTLIASSLLVVTAGTQATQDTIPEIATASGRLDTLVAAVGAADLAGALSGDGPFTVFAPTDEAFARLDPDVIKGLLEEPGRRTLTRILTHHVIPARLEARDLLAMDEVETLAGTTLSLAGLKGRLLVDDAAVESANISASNGVVHLIDRVLLPPAQVDPVESLLYGAIERGVPLFNNGSPEACCAVYATALEALMLGGGNWGLNDRQVKGIERTLKDAKNNGDAGERAWVYRRMMDAILSSERMVMTSTTEEAVEPGVSNFFPSNNNKTSMWGTVLDGVMGGLSTGEITVQNGVMRFTGETSLRNNGGFSMARTIVADNAFADQDAIRMRVKGDGRTYILGARKRRDNGESYWARFDTVEGEWVTVTIPISEMECHFFGQKRPGRISGEEIGAIEIYIYDKKAGPFEIEIESIDAINEMI